MGAPIRARMPAAADRWPPGEAVPRQARRTPLLAEALATRHQPERLPQAAVQPAARTREGPVAPRLPEVPQRRVAAQRVGRALGVLAVARLRPVEAARRVAPPTVA